MITKANIRVCALALILALILTCGVALADSSDSGIPADPKYLDREVCAEEAPSYVEQTGLGAERIAKELYAHTVLYYGSATLEKAGALAKLAGVDVAALDESIAYVQEHAGIIDLGGDSEERLEAYDLIWELPDWFVTLLVGDTSKLVAPEPAQ